MILVNRYNADLANELGNLFSRTAAMIVKYFGGNLGTGSFDAGSDLYDDTVRAIGGYREYMERMEFSRALGAYWTVVQRANRYIEEQRPWDLAKDEAKHDRLREVLRELIVVLRISGKVLTPFMPEKMNEMLAASPDWAPASTPPLIWLNSTSPLISTCTRAAEAVVVSAVTAHIAMNFILPLPFCL